jgi:FAD synthetase
MLNWDYKDIWQAILLFHIPYCSLYDCGYTSLGSKGNTFPNSKLKTSDGYLPAYELLDINGDLERAGRICS